MFDRYKLGFYEPGPYKHLMWLVCMTCETTLFERSDDSGPVNLSTLTDIAKGHEKDWHSDSVK